MASELKLKDRREYTVYGLFAAGSRFTDDYDQDDAVEQYLQLHPGANAADVRAELAREVAAHGG